jgi:hypothetical protein
MFNLGDIVVRIDNSHHGMSIGMISRIVGFERDQLRLHDFNPDTSHMPENFRHATDEEAFDYRQKHYTSTKLQIMKEVYGE